MSSTAMIEWLETRHLLTATWDTQPDTWVGVDALGRALPTSTEAGAPRARTVGVFFFLTGGQDQLQVYDNSKILAANPTNPQWGPVGAAHYWGQPIWGYYNGQDPAVIRKQLQMLADAGVDFICLDNTNGLIYPTVLNSLMNVMSEMISNGLPTPRWCSLASNSSAQQLWDTVYSKNIHPETWYQWQGKPLIMMKELDSPPAQVTSSNFTIRRSWAWNGTWFGNGQGAWPWLQDDPTQYGWDTSPSVPEEMAAAIASHPTITLGRSYHNGEPSAANARPELGIRFTDQTIPIMTNDPSVAFLTGWNEWTAGRFVADGDMTFAGKTIHAGDTYFVDEYTEEYSRDAEPMMGGHGDDYYYQLVSFIRKFKGVRAIQPVTASPILIDGNFADWSSIGPDFRDDINDPVNRTSAGLQDVGWGGGPIVNHTGRNDIVEAKVSDDATNVYFYARTIRPLTSSSDPNWMILFIDADRNPNTGWMGYDYVLNRTRGSSWAMLQANVGGTYNWADVTKVPMRVGISELEIAVTRAALGLAPDARGVDFKWADNIQQTGDWSDYTLNGDVAPNDRFNYRAEFVESGSAVSASWQSADVGPVPAPGISAADYTDSLTLTDRGSDIGGTADQFRFTYQPLNGDGEIIAHVADLDRADDSSKAGIMIRETLASGSKNVFLSIGGYRALQLTYRSTINFAAKQFNSPASAPFDPIWLRLVRSGNTFTAYTRAKASDSWSLFGAVAVSMNSNVSIGLALTSHNASVSAIARFDSISVLPDHTPPVVTWGTFDDQTRQEVVIRFNEDVTGSVTVDDFSLRSLTFGQPLPNSLMTLATTPAGTATTARVQFTSRLAGGRYRLTVKSSGISDSTGNAMTADVSLDFIAYGGDANRDGIINALDFNLLASNFGALGVTFGQGDFNYDSVVNTLDFNTLASRFGAALPAPILPIAAFGADRSPSAPMSTSSLFAERPHQMERLDFDRELTRFD